MSNFYNDYREVFAALGYELQSTDGVPELEIAEAESRLGLSVPLALREYYLVAGRESNYNQVFNRLLAPSEWSIDAEHLVFMEENQAVVLWGVAATLTAPEDAPVFQGVGRKRVWHPEHPQCSTFLKVMVHWHGAFGGAMQHTATTHVDGAAALKVLDREWTFVGEVNHMRAYSLQGCAVCFLKWEDRMQKERGLPPWVVFAGADSERQLQQIRDSLKVEWES
jgi:hypothetical protein